MIDLPNFIKICSLAFSSGFVATIGAISLGNLIHSIFRMFKNFTH